MSAPTRPLAALAVISLAEGAALIAYGLFDLVEALRLGAGGPSDVSNGPAIAVQIGIFAAFGAGLVWVARGWWGSRRWARAPFLLAQVMAVLVGYQLAQAAGSASRIAGIGIALVAALGIVLAFAPRVSGAIQE